MRILGMLRHLVNTFMWKNIALMFKSCFFKLILYKQYSA